MHRYLISAIDRLEVVVAGLFVSTMATAVFIQVVLRSLADVSLAWVEEYAVLSLIWATFLGAAIAYRRSEHLVVSLFAVPKNASLRRYRDLVAEIFVSAVCICVIVACIRVMPRESQVSSFSLPIAVPRSFFFSVPTLYAFSSIFLTSLIRVVADLTGRRPIASHNPDGII